MRRYLPWLLRLIGPALFIGLLARSDLPAFWHLLLGADPLPILLSLALLPPFILIKSWRWQLLLHELDLHLPLPTAIALYTVGIYLGAVTPGQAGDLLKAWYIRQRGQPLAPALLSVVLDRLCDLLVMAILATLGILALGQLLPSRQLQIALIILMGVGLTILTVLLVARRPRHWLMTGLLPAILPTRLHASLQRWNTQFATLTMHPRLTFLVICASLVSAMFTFYRLWLLFVALDVFIPLYVVIGISALTAVVQVLPISIGGLGVRDAVLIAALLPYGYSPEQAISVSTLFLLLTVEHVVVGFIVSFWFPLSRALSQRGEPDSDSRPFEEELQQSVP